MEPVKKSEAPDYYEVIRFPIGEDTPFRPFPSSLAPKSTPAPAFTGPYSPARLSLLKACLYFLLPQT